jgi:N-acetylmuramoyl-L-alanine amidase
MSMKIANHRLQGVRFDKSNHTGGEIVPKFIVMHYTAGGSMDSSLRGIDSRGLSAHLFVDRDGGIAQTVPFNVKAFHAGPSEWRGFVGLNGHAIGIENCNFGFFDKRTASGWIREGLSRTFAEHEVIVARHKNGGPSIAWEIFPEAQLRALDAIVVALREKYPSIQEVVGHDDISPGRKVDPGPAFPMARFQHLGGAAGSGTLAADDLGRFAVSVRSTLNLRGGPGTDFEVIAALKDGTELRGLFDRGDWIAVDLQGDGVKDGFVHKDFLRRLGD